MSRRSSLPKTRRQMLRALGAWSAAGLAAPVLLAACGGATAAVSSPTSAARVSSAAITASQAATSAAATTAPATSVAAVAATAATSAASSPAATVAAAASAPTSASGSLTFLHWWTGSLGTDFKTYMDWAFAEYKSRTGVTVIGIDSKPVTDTNNKFVAGVAGGAPPDAAFTDVRLGSDLEEQGILAAPDSYVAQAPDVQDDQFFDAAKQFHESRGHTFGIPVMGPESECIGINQGLFESAGLDPTGADIKTWDDLVRVGQRLIKTGADGGVAVAGIGTSGGIDLSSFPAWVETTGHSLYDAGQNTAYYNAPETVAALQFLVDLANKDNVGAPPGTKNRPTGEAALANGTAAMEFDETAMGSFPTMQP
jgi:ABC-type glycerol-3-phosphate transport system substrate-binding protein